MFAINNKKIFLSIGVFLTLASWILIGVFGLKLSIDFSGGSIAEYSFEGSRPEVSLIKETLLPDYGSVSVRNTGNQGVLIRMRGVSPDEQDSVSSFIASISDGEINLERFNTVGPLAGGVLLKKALIATIISVIIITLFVMIAFRKVSKRVPSSKYAFATVLALIHDISIPAGAFAVLGFFFGMEIDLLFITAILAVLGYSINDTIVVFDRIRENLLLDEKRQERFEELVGKSLKETLGRSINTSLTLIITLVILLIVSNASVYPFILTLLIGIIAGTYSSIFLASPLLTVLNRQKSQAS